MNFLQSYRNVSVVIHTLRKIKVTVKKSVAPEGMEYIQEKSLN